MRSVCQVLSKQERLQVASEGGTVEIRVSQFIRQCIPSCRRSHGKGTTTIGFQLEPWGDDNNNNNNNKHDNVYGAVIMAEPLREFTRFI